MELDLQERRMRRALSTALVAGLALAGCNGAGSGSIEEPQDTADSDDTDEPTDTGDTDEPDDTGDTDEPDDTGDTGDTPEGVTPPGLATVCAGEWLDHVSLAEPVDFLALRRSEGWTDAFNNELYATGTPCATATDEAACLATLAETWPTYNGWGYCGEGCTKHGLVTTLGDVVGLHETTEEVTELFGQIDTPADALMLARTKEYAPDCMSVLAMPDGSWQMQATILISDCPWTEEVRDIAIDREGAFQVLQVVDVIEDGACAGRLPDGVCGHAPVMGDAVARHVAHLAWLEAAAVVAFERLAVDLRRLGAPDALVQRALAAAADEVDHAARMTALAERLGATVPPVQVAPHAERSLLEVALENATEGCVRETYGVVDARYRSQRAEHEELRSLFARIADDEARHAALSWAIASWLDGQLSDEERAQVAAAAERAHEALVAALRQDRPDAVQRRLGAPAAPAAVAMATTLRGELAVSAPTT